VAEVCRYPISGRLSHPSMEEIEGKGTRSFVGIQFAETQ